MVILLRSQADQLFDAIRAMKKMAHSFNINYSVAHGMIYVRRNMDGSILITEWDKKHGATAQEKYLSEFLFIGAYENA